MQNVVESKNKNGAIKKKNIKNIEVKSYKNHFKRT
jgi:hypothetical protein